MNAYFVLFNASLSSKSGFLTKLLISGILSSTIVNAAFVARLLISGILFSTIVNTVFVAKLILSGIFPSISVILGF